MLEPPLVACGTGVVHNFSIYSDVLGQNESISQRGP